jgi:hypothetical protein
MLAALSAGKVPVKPIRINPAAQQSISPALQALLSRSVELKVGRGGVGTCGQVSSKSVH